MPYLATMKPVLQINTNAAGASARDKDGACRDRLCGLVMTRFAEDWEQADRSAAGLLLTARARGR